MTYTKRLAILMATARRLFGFGFERELEGFERAMRQAIANKIASRRIPDEIGWSKMTPLQKLRFTNEGSDY